MDNNLIDGIKDDLLRNDLKYDISLYNNLSKSQIFYLDPKKSSSLTISEFKYNRFFLDVGEKNNIMNIMDIMKPIFLLLLRIINYAHLYLKYNYFFLTKND